MVKRRTKRRQSKGVNKARRRGNPKRRTKKKRSVWDFSIEYKGLGGLVVMLLIGGFVFFLTTLYAIPYFGLSSDGTFLGDLSFGILGFLIFGLVFVGVVVISALISRVFKKIRNG